MNISDLMLCEQDALGEKILRFYAHHSPQYAVYQTTERVAVQFADAVDDAGEQRKSLSQLAPVLSEINGLLQSWHNAPDTQRFIGFVPVRNGKKLRDQADRYDRRIGDALVVALEGDLTGAGDVIKAIKEDILDERVGWARLEYIISALVMAAQFIIFALLVNMLAFMHHCVEGGMPLCFPQATNLWRGAMGGALGAFFSIALGVSDRTVLTDLHRTSNLTDAALRVVIGTIAGTVLVALLLDDLVVIKIGDSMPINANSLYIAIAGFLGGFSERLVPDLLASAGPKTGATPIVRTPIRDAATKPDAPDATMKSLPAPADAPDTGADVDAKLAPVQQDSDAAAPDATVDQFIPDKTLPSDSAAVKTVVNAGIKVGQPPV